MKRLPDWAQTMLDRSCVQHNSDYSEAIQREAGGNASVADFAGSLVEEVERLREVVRTLRRVTRDVIAGWTPLTAFDAETERLVTGEVPSPKGIGMLPMYSEQIGEEFDEKKGWAAGYNNGTNLF